MRSSISRQLVLWLAIPLMLLAMCGGLVHYLNSVAPSVINSDQRLKETTAALMAHVRVVDHRVALVTDVGMAPPLPTTGAVLFALRDSQGRLLEGDPRIPVVPLPGNTGQSVGLTQIGNRNYRSLTTRLDSAGGVVMITVADTRSGGEPMARYGLISTLLWDFVQLDITLVLVWIGVQAGLRPVKRLRQEIGARSPRDLRPLDESSVPREIAPAVATLNRLFATLRTSAQSQQQFIANTAHQLRTPITGLQAQLDLLLAEPAAAAVKHRLEILREGMSQLSHSANQLLTLARADPGANVAARIQPVDLSSIVGEVAARFFDRALACDIDFGVDNQGMATVQADASLLDDLLSNLVDNALKYTPSGGQITVSTSVQNGKAILAVTDSGPGIPESERGRVMQRFYRMPNSVGHGSGLGLAIVDEIAQLFGGSINIESGAGGGGTRIVLQFPNASR